ncbi:hypothetical protein [Dethiosulfovibrio salsuginis]|uniref:Uncharacterized protein n=1 Tax=Dethiosulfovibrio salsuginis TaxID=561720 RepID=A0A1X7I4U5_9BACT|nr:hypothetical protein [Dethiosulfovibrio salsuginis]SMG09472.1 hypothetical protein SAMN06275492_101124 [Dethiosulfovibrio salsuginis]
MSLKKARCFRRLNDVTCSYWMGLDDLDSLEEDVTSDQELRLPPEEDFISTVDLWWGDFLSELME